MPRSHIQLGWSDSFPKFISQQLSVRFGIPWQQNWDITGGDDLRRVLATNPGQQGRGSCLIKLGKFDKIC